MLRCNDNLRHPLISYLKRITAAQEGHHLLVRFGRHLCLDTAFILACIPFSRAVQLPLPRRLTIAVHLGLGPFASFLLAIRFGLLVLDLGLVRNAFLLGSLSVGMSRYRFV